MYKLKSLFASLFLACALLFVAGCDSSTDPVDQTELASPTNATVTLDQASGSYAIVGWTASTDETLSDFVGYIVTTYEVSSTGTKIAKFDSVVVNKPTHTKNVLSLVTGKYYRSYIHSLLDNDDFSIALETNIYGGVVVGTSKTIDQYSTSSTTSSAYGWTTAGAGEQVPYTSANNTKIDIHCRVDNAGNLTLYSPANAPAPQLTSPRATAFLALTADDWYASKFNVEPNKTSIAITEGDVILVKNADGYYVKLKIQSIATQGTGTAAYKKVTFDYKFQNVHGLRAAKQ